jgi:hypothetical protein
MAMHARSSIRVRFIVGVLSICVSYAAVRAAEPESDRVSLSEETVTWSTVRYATDADNGFVSGSLDTHTIVDRTFRANVIHLGHDEPTIIGRDRDAVGKSQSIGNDARLAIGHHQDDAADRPSIGRRRQIEAEIADISAAKSVDDHVVDRTRRYAREAGVERKLAVRESHQTLAEHRQHDDLAIRQDTEAAWRIVLELRVLFTLAGWGET